MKVLPLFALLTCLPALASSIAEGPHAFKLGIGLAGGQYGSGISIDLASPRFLSVEVASAKRRTDFHFFLQSNILNNDNLLQVGGTFTSVSNAALSAGILSQLISLEGGAISPYSRIGVDVLFPSSLLASGGVNVGMRVAFGCDIFFVRQQDTFLGNTDESFFVEGSIVLLHKGADRIAGTPTIFGGFLPQVGFRAHF